MVYNQNKTDNHPSDCTLYVLYTILYIQYWIKCKYSFIDKTVDKATRFWVLTRWGAYFSTIYKWFANQVYKRTWIRLLIKKVNIISEEFETLLKQWYAFGLWLKYGNRVYLNAIKKWKLTKDDIVQIEHKRGWFAHNHCYFYENDKYYIWEVYTWQKIECDISVLRYAVNLWVYYVPARTLEPVQTKLNKVIEKNLREFKQGKHRKDNKYFTKKMNSLKWDEKKWFMQAYQLYILKRLNTK